MNGPRSAPVPPVDDGAPGASDAIAAEALALLGTGLQTAPFSERHAGFGLASAYRVTSDVRAGRERRGERAIGRKIGFTNRTIWAEYDVHQPIWGHVYDSTVRDLAPGAATVVSLSGLAEPRIEPEIVFGLAEAPHAGMSVQGLLDCIGWVAHGFEIVQSIFPDWRFAPADTVAGYGLHGALLIGTRHAVAAAARHDWLTALASFRIALFRNGALVDRGAAENVLDGPLHALHHLVGLLAADPINPPLAAGEIVTTGTLTRAFPIVPGEAWHTELDGIGLDPAHVSFRA